MDPIQDVQGGPNELDLPIRASGPHSQLSMLRGDVESGSGPVSPITDRMIRSVRIQGRQGPILDIGVSYNRSLDTFVRQPRLSLGEVSDQDRLEADSIVRSRR